MATTDNSITVLWLLFNGVLVFFMQSGFAMLEAGSIQKKNAKNIIIKNIADIAMAAILFWLVGFGFAYGGTGRFIGDKDYFGVDGLGDKYDSTTLGSVGFMDWFFQFAFAATSATIVSGAVAERTRFLCYLLYSSILTGFVYPVIVHWVWGGGWLAEEGVHDFAGSGVVHMTGGCAGLIGTLVIGPRIGRFEGERFHVTVNEISPNSIVFSALGVLILWTGWYGFNVGSTLAISGADVEEQAELVAINTTICPAASALTCLIIPSLWSMYKDGKAMVKPEPLLNGVLAGLVGITAGCATMLPSLAFVTGIISGLVYMGSSSLLVQLKIDDPLDAIPVHYFCGFWGVLAVGLFADEKYTGLAGLSDHGAFMGGSGDLLGWQLTEAIVITLWVGGLSLCLFLPLKMLGLARVSPNTEVQGIDLSHHGGYHSASVAAGLVKPANPALSPDSHSKVNNEANSGL